MDWFYANENNEQVSVSEEELKTLVEGGSVRPDSLVWNEEMPDWKPCREVKPEWFGGGMGELAPALSRPSARAASEPAPNSVVGASVAYSPALPRTVPAGPPTDGLALASMICGIAGLLFMFCYGAGLPVSIAAVICGHLCRRRLLAEGNTSSAGMALAGLITGYVGIAIVIIFIGIFLAFFGFAVAMAPDSSTITTP